MLISFLHEPQADPIELADGASHAHQAPATTARHGTRACQLTGRLEQSSTRRRTLHTGNRDVSTRRQRPLAGGVGRDEHHMTRVRPRRSNSGADASVDDHDRRMSISGPALKEVIDGFPTDVFRHDAKPTWRDSVAMEDVAHVGHASEQ